MKTLRYFRLRSIALDTTHNTKMNKWRVKIISRVLLEVKVHFPEIIQVIEGCIEQECSKENITLEEIIFLFTCLEAKS